MIRAGWLCGLAVAVAACSNPPPPSLKDVPRTSKQYYLACNRGGKCFRKADLLCRRRTRFERLDLAHTPSEMIVSCR